MGREGRGELGASAATGRGDGGAEGLGERGKERTRKRETHMGLVGGGPGGTYKRGGGPKGVSRAGGRAGG